MKKGFTLVELMVIIVIVGILTSLAVSRFINLHNSDDSTGHTKRGNVTHTRW